MAKLTLSPIASAYQSTTQLNDNFDAIEAAIENTLSRDGSTPNTMEADLDMNGFTIINLKEPTASNEVARLQDVQNAIAGGAANLITFTPHSIIESANLQAAIEELADASLLSTDTIATLRTLVPTDYSTIYVKGYFNPGDGGGGPLRVWDAASTATDDGGAVIKPTAIDAADPGRWVWEYEGPINVAWFGAVGTADDAPAINAAIAYAKTLLNNAERSADGNGIEVMLDRDHIIQSPINLTGLRSSFAFVFNGNGATIHAKTTAKQAIDALGSKRIIFQNFTVWADLADNVYWGLTLGRKTTGETADDHRLYNVTFQGYYTKACMYNVASEQVTYHSCFFMNDYDSGSNAYCIVMDSYNSFGVTSDYATLTGLTADTSSSFNANQFYGCRFYRRSFDGNDSITYAIYMDQNCQKHHYQSCYLVAGRTAAIKIAYRDSATGGWDDLNGFYFDSHIEKYGGASALLYSVQFISDTGTKDAIAHDFVFKDNNPHSTASIFNVTNLNSMKMVNCDISIIRTSTGTPVLCLPQADISYIGRIAIPATMGTQTFNGAMGDIQLTLRNGTHALVNTTLTAATVPIRIYDEENLWVANKPDYPVTADLASIITGTVYVDTTASNVLKVK